MKTESRIEGGLNKCILTCAGFDLYGRVQDQDWVTTSPCPEDRDRYKYGYDYNSRRIYQNYTLQTNTDWRYTYDGLDQLTTGGRGTLQNPPSGGLASTNFLQAWTLDLAGNWPGFNEGPSTNWSLVQTRAHNLVNEITNITETTGPQWVVPAYDSRGNMTAGPQPGNETNRLDFIYDAWNRLVKVAGHATTNTLGEYRFDGLNRRIRKYVPVSGTNWTVREFYYNNAWQCLEIRKNTRGRTGSPLPEPSVVTNIYEQYVWSQRYLDAPVLRDRDADGNGTLEERGYYCSDVHFNVTLLVDTNGGVLERYAYSPYGRPTFLGAHWNDITNSAYANEVLFSGYRYDSESLTYQVRHRQYHPTLGRWLTRDPIGDETFLRARTDWMDVEEHAEFFSSVVWPALAHLYQFVDNDPVDAIDPWGDLLLKLPKKPKPPKEPDKKATYKVGECEIVLFYGHGWISFFDGVSVNKCGGTTAVTCQSQIIFQHLAGLIPGAVDSGGNDVQWGGLTLPPRTVRAGPLYIANIAAMEKYARNTLLKSPCCCKKVELLSHCVGSSWECLNLFGGGFGAPVGLPKTIP